MSAHKTVEIKLNEIAASNKPRKINLMIHSVNVYTDRRRTLLCAQRNSFNYLQFHSAATEMEIRYECALCTLLIKL